MAAGIHPAIVSLIETHVRPADRIPRDCLSIPFGSSAKVGCGGGQYTARQFLNVRFADVLESVTRTDHRRPTTAIQRRVSAMSPSAANASRPVR
jgi:hypothetical protein